ncbi:MAG TPA: VCBS repeat-containing protein [Saprospiraceae bacterium]|nr:VCBS repeat-containing protein [Saprospiraceae bacterium]
MKYIPVFLLLFWSCRQTTTPDGAAFQEVPRSQTNIEFRNLLVEKETFNIFKYQYFYNGGGTAIGDFNNDGLQDLVFTGNMVKNRLYLNKGDLAFEDITQSSGIAALEGWCTGATPVDINQDGWLDLYICRAGYPFDNLRSNLLFINKGGKTPVFEEKSAEYGLNDLAHSTHASFFDYDKDGDLDLFLLNHSTVEYSRGSLDIYQIRGKKHPEYTNKLFRNDGGKTFTNVTEAAGITSNVLSFSLGISTCDINRDGWPDIFIGNDFNEPDYLFINQHNGTFTEELSQRIDHSSMFSMGCDIADFNGDTWPDLVTLDMLPEGNHLQKMHSGADNFEKVYTMMRSGFGKQYSRNMLQRNNGDGTFSEVGQMAGVSNTDWSWSSLFFDFDNDGLRDLFVSNGYPRDHTNMDFLKFTADEVLRMQKGEKNIGFQEYLQKMPPIIEANYFFKNLDGEQFSNQAAAWGLGTPVVTQSAAWADFDNDGDLDLALNNTNDYASILENKSEQQPDNHWLRIQLKGKPGNPWGIGAQILAYGGGKTFFLEQNPVRGFQSSVDPVLSLGLGSVAMLDSLVITWPTMEQQVLTGVKSKQTLQLDITQARPHTNTPVVSPTLFVVTSGAMPFKHQENESNDLKKQALLPWFYSRMGPAMAAADVNGDGYEDLYLGGAQGQAGVLLLGNATGTFSPLSQAAFNADAACEDQAAVFFDANGDGAKDLFVCSGGYDVMPDAPAMQHRLYLNNGKGLMIKAASALPELRQPGACVQAADVENDGDMDLFVGAGVMPGQYPQTGNGYILINDGRGKFSQGPMFAGASLGVWLQTDSDPEPELITAGEWLPIQRHDNQKGSFSDAETLHLSGLWSSLYATDLDGDGDQDVVAGNLGLNTQLRASEQEPLELYSDDFDKNGSLDPLMFYYVQGKSYPLASLEDLTGQLPYLRKKFNYFKDYADAQVGDILTAAQIEAATHLSARSLETGWLENLGNGKFAFHPFQKEAQIAPVQAIASLDANADGLMDLVLAGNRTHARVKLGNLGGNHGQLWLNQGNKSFRAISYDQSGLQVRGDVRNLSVLSSGNKKILVFGLNNAAPAVYTTKSPK